MIARAYAWAILFALTLTNSSAHAACADWPLWNQFAKEFIQSDGRVVDYDAQSVSTSEGQAYALFFSLIAGDRQRFDRILHWAENNLAQGDLTIHLPAWKWGRAENGRWEVLDANPASDADLWLAYGLLQAGKHWKSDAYTRLGQAILRQIRAHEVADLPGVGPMLLPAPYGFVPKSDVWRLNPSYMPVQLLRYFSKIDHAGPWNKIATQVPKMLAATSVRGVVPDWIQYQAGSGYQQDAEHGAYSSYEAVRVYLWWGMLHPKDPLDLSLRSTLQPAAAWLTPEQALYEKVRATDGVGSGKAPSGFYAAMTPFFARSDRAVHLALPPLSKRDGYYSYALTLFGSGWMERRFAFAADGALLPSGRGCRR